MSDHFVIGQRQPRIDGVEKVTGAAEYTEDILLPNILIGKALRSRFAHAKILSIDISEAEALPGVKAVVTYRDIPNNQDVLGVTVGDQPILAENEVRHLGDPVAVVAAVDEETAQEALRRIKVEYEELPAVFDPEEAMQPGAPLAHMGTESNVVARRKVRHGDVEEGFRQADFVFEDRYQTQGVDHAPLETDMAMVRFEPDGTLTVWAPTQAPFQERVILSRSLGIPHNKIRVIVPTIGGGFGGKMAVHALYLTAVLAKKAGIGKPVRMVHTREEDLYCSTIRHPATIYLKTGIKKDGTITARQCTYILEMGAYVHYGDLVTQWVGQTFAGVYRTPHLSYDGISVYTNNPYGGAFRGFGDPQLTFAVEGHMDSIAEKLGLDAVELRLKNAAEVGETTASGWKLKSCGLKDCIRQAAAEIGWNEKRGRRETVDGKVRGVGLACGEHASGWRGGFNPYQWRVGYTSLEAALKANPCSPYITFEPDNTPAWRFGFPLDTPSGLYDADASCCYLTVNEDGTVLLKTGEVDEGQGAKTALAQIVAEELGVRVEDVRVAPTDTDSGTFAMGTYSSRVTLVGGQAALAAAKEAKKQLFQIASKILEASPDDLQARDGKIFVRGYPDKSLFIADVAFRAYASREGGYIMTKGYYDPDSIIPDKETGQGSVAAAFLFFAQAIELEVDTRTGEVNILQVASAHDVGKTINPMSAEGQVEGAFAQGLGFGLMENLVWDRGRTLNANLIDYKVPTALDTPSQIQSIFVETDEPNGPFGAKGVAEPALCPVPPAMANAIYDAVGVKIKELPITPQKVLMAIEEKHRSF